MSTDPINRPSVLPSTLSPLGYPSNSLDTGHLQPQRGAVPDQFYEYTPSNPFKPARTTTSSPIFESQTRNQQEWDQPVQHRQSNPYYYTRPAGNFLPPARATLTSLNPLSPRPYQINAPIQPHNSWRSTTTAGAPSGTARLMDPFESLPRPTGPYPTSQQMNSATKYQPPPPPPQLNTTFYNEPALCDWEVAVASSPRNTIKEEYEDMDRLIKQCYRSCQAPSNTTTDLGSPNWRKVKAGISYRPKGRGQVDDLGGWDSKPRTEVPSPEVIRRGRSPQTVAGNDGEILSATVGMIPIREVASHIEERGRTQAAPRRSSSCGQLQDGSQETTREEAMAPGDFKNAHGGSSERMHSPSNSSPRSGHQSPDMSQYTFVDAAAKCPSRPRQVAWTSSSWREEPDDDTQWVLVDDDLKSRRAKHIIRTCIKSPMAFPTTWYTHPQAPDFYICTKCYEDHVKGSLFEFAFRGMELNDGKPRFCRFSKPRVEQHLFRVAKATKSLDVFVSYMQKRSTIPDCRGRTRLKVSDSVSWYKTDSFAVPNMTVCEACHEDYIMSRHFSGKFSLLRKQEEPSSKVLSCSFAIPFIRRQYFHDADRNDWDAFCHLSKKRLALADCSWRLSAGEGDGFSYGAVTRGGSLYACQACYRDHVVGTALEPRWRKDYRPSSSYRINKGCSFGQSDVLQAVEIARELDDYNIFWEAVEDLDSVPKCAKDAALKGSCFTLTTKSGRNLDICEGCFHAVAGPLGLASLFNRRGVYEGNESICFFHDTSPRHQLYMGKAIEAFYKHDSTILENFVEQNAFLPPCPREKEVNNRRWYGWKECIICPECWHTFICGTDMEKKMTMVNEEIRSLRTCEMYSNRMRTLYMQACKSGNLALLFAAVVERRVSYLKTVLSIRRLMGKFPHPASVRATSLLGYNKNNNINNKKNNDDDNPTTLVDPLEAHQVNLAPRHTSGGVASVYLNVVEARATDYASQVKDLLLDAKANPTILGSRLNIVKSLENEWRKVE